MVLSFLKAVTFPTTLPSLSTVPELAWADTQAQSITLTGKGNDL